MGETRSNGSQIYLKVQPGRGLSEGGNHSQCKGSSHQRNSQRGHLGFHHCGPGALGRRRLLTGALPAAVPSCLLPSMASCLVPALLLLLLLGEWLPPSRPLNLSFSVPDPPRSSRKRWEHKKVILGKAKMQEEAPVRHLCPRFEDTHSTLPPAFGPRGAMASQISPW